MTRFRIVAIHALALPLSMVLFIGISVALTPVWTRRAVDVSVDDSTYVVAHLHASVFLVVFLIICTALQRARHSLNNWLWLAWGLTALHVTSAALIPGIWITKSAGSVYVFAASISRWDRLIAYAYVATASLALVSGLIALTMSTAAQLRGIRPTP